MLVIARSWILRAKLKSATGGLVGILLERRFLVD